MTTIAQQHFEEFMIKTFPEMNIQKLQDGTYRDYNTYKIFVTFCAGYVKGRSEHSVVVMSNHKSG